MALAEGIQCDAEMIETFRLVLSKISPSELEIYAASTPEFSRGGFRRGNVTFIRSQLLSMISSQKPIDEKLRSMLRSQIRRSLEAGGSNVHLQKELETAKQELSQLKGADAKLKSETEKCARLEAEFNKAKNRLETLEAECGPMRNRLERLEAELRKATNEAERKCDAILQVRLAKELASLGLSSKRPRSALAEGESAFNKTVAALETISEKDLPEWKGTISKMTSAGVFSKEEEEFLLSILRRRYSALHMRGFDDRELKEEDLSKPGGVFIQALSGRLPAILLIDAHNTLFALQSRYRLPSDHRWPTAQTRQWLVEDVVQLLENTPSVRAYIVFDGPERTESTASHNVQVIYSGGTGEHRADDVLVDQAKFLSQAGAENLIIITNDGELAGRASRHGAKNLAPTALLTVF